MTLSKLFPLFCLAIAVYGSHPLEKVYDHREFLDGKSKYQLLWSVDRAAEEVEFACIVNTTGWIGFGIAKGMAGKMEGSDIVIGFVSSDGKGYLQDSHGIGNTVPVKDEKNDYILKGSEEKDGQTILRFFRKFKTCDQQDNPIIDGTMKIIYAYHDTDPESDFQSGFNYHDFNRGSLSMNLLHFIPQVKLDDKKDHIDLVENKLNVPSKDTSYWCKLHTIKRKDIDGKRHVIGYAPVLNPPNNPYAHHLTIQKCPASLPDHLKNRTGHCYTPYMQHYSTYCTTHLFSWTPGAREIVFPDHLGFAIGEEEEEYYMIQMHYDNPKESTDIIDSSGIRFYLSDTLRQHEIGIIRYGVQVTGALLLPPQQKEWFYDGYCTPECFQNETIPHSKNNSIRIFGAFLHEHLTGNGVWLNHIRGDTEIAKIAGDDSYDFNFQNLQILGKEHEFRLNTDTLNVKCRYNTMKRTEMTQGGLGTYDEMCTGRFLYYPKVNITSCWSKNVEIEKFTKKYAPESNLKLAEFLHYRNWTNVPFTDEMIQTLKDLEKQRKRSVECTVRNHLVNKINYDTEIPVIKNPLPQPDDQCPQSLYASNANKNNLTIHVFLFTVLLNVFYII